MKKVLFVLKRRSEYGVSFGLINSCNFVKNWLETIGIEAKVVQVLDNNKIDFEVHNYKPTHVIIESLWVVPSKINELINKYKKIQWIARVHSCSPFLSREGIAFEWLKEYWKISQKYDNFTISCNNQRLQKELSRALGIESSYSPNIYCPPSYLIFPRKDHQGFLNVGCFGAIRELKAHGPQALAALSFGNLQGLKIRFHINGNRLEGAQTDGILKNLINLFKESDHELVIHDWMTHEQFDRLIQEQIDIGMAVSFSESYCIIAYDYVTNNIPVVGSKEIQYILPIFKADPTDNESMVECFKLAYISRFTGLHCLNKALLWWGNYRAKRAWNQLLCNHWGS